MILRVFIGNNITVQLTDDQQHRVLIDLSGLLPEFTTTKWRDTTHFDHEDDYRKGCRNVSYCQQ